MSVSKGLTPLLDVQRPESLSDRELEEGGCWPLKTERRGAHVMWT